ncbi:rubrerythrin-like domain-containing protein [Halobacteriales archaeon Cl-PHB]
MRGKTTGARKKAYECYTCRNRVTDPDRPVCENCGSDMLNISRARDL